jgi:hypothetical protein
MPPPSPDMLRLLLKVIYRVLLDSLWCRIADLISRNLGRKYSFSAKLEGRWDSERPDPSLMRLRARGSRTKGDEFSGCPAKRGAAPGISGRGSPP